MANLGRQRVFTVSALIVLALVAVGAAFPEQFGSVANAALGAIGRYLG